MNRNPMSAPVFAERKHGKEVADQLFPTRHFKFQFRTFEENEEIKIRFLKTPFAASYHRAKPKAPECPICRDHAELTHKERYIPVFTPNQDPTRDQPAYLLMAKDSSPFYSAKHLILRDES